MSRDKSFNHYAGPRGPASQNPVRSIVAVTAVVLIDLVAVLISLGLAYLLRNHLLLALFPTLISGKLLAQTFELFWWYPLAFIVCLAYEKLYHRRLPFWIEVQWIMKAGTLTLFLTIVLLYLVRIGDEISRSLVILTWVFAILALPLFRYYGKKVLLKLGIWNRPIIIIGNSETIPLIHNAFEREKTMGYRVVGCIRSTLEKAKDGASGAANSPAQQRYSAQKLHLSPAYNEEQIRFQGRDWEKEREVDQVSGLPCLGPLAEAESIIRATGVEDLVIADPTLSSAEQVELTNTLQPLVKYITLVPDLFGVSLSGIEAAYFFEEQVVLLQIKNRLRSRISSAFKRCFDLIIGTLLTILALPLMLFIALAIKFDSPGPVFYISKRIGRGGSEFNCIKFRTMLRGCDKILEDYLAKNEEARREWECYNKLISSDPRVTRVGNILRRLSLDELPQLFNILHGKMSLAGPRPYLPREQAQMGSFAHDILVGKPGLTGLWQVSGRNMLSFESRLRLDSWYMKNWSLWLDMVILMKTVRVVMKREGAY